MFGNFGKKCKIYCLGFKNLIVTVKLNKRCSMQFYQNRVVVEWEINSETPWFTHFRVRNSNYLFIWQRITPERVFYYCGCDITLPFIQFLSYSFTNNKFICKISYFLYLWGHLFSFASFYSPHHGTGPVGSLPKMLRFFSYIFIYFFISRLRAVKIVVECTIINYCQHISEIKVMQNKLLPKYLIFAD